MSKQNDKHSNNQKGSNSKNEKGKPAGKQAESKHTDKAKEKKKENSLEKWQDKQQEQLERIRRLLVQNNLLIENNNKILLDLADRLLDLPQKFQEAGLFPAPVADFYDAAFVMKKLDISNSTYYRMVKTGTLKPNRINRRHTYTAQQINELGKS